MMIQIQALAAVLPLALFMFVSSITPGPNNLMLMNSGMRFGLRRTVPHALGVTIGLVIVMALSYAGIGTLLSSRPALLRIMTLACSLYLLWLGYGLLRSTKAAPGQIRAGNRDRAMSALEAILFQFVNPKVWAMTLTACSIAVNFPLPAWMSLAVLLLLSAGVNLPCISVWAVFGDRLRLRLQKPGFRLGFNISMASLVAATAVWMLVPVLRVG
jgi:threonine/homoserine/homoserine lactone efflux protein